MKTELQNLPACEPDGRHWFWHGEQVLELLELHRPYVCVELGSWKGGSAIAVARLLQRWGGRLFCVDVWDGAVPRSECAANIRNAGVADAVTLTQSSTLDAAKSWETPIDYLYVDADHSAEGCYADLVAWWPHLRVGGLIAGDDYDDPRWGVTAAWDRFEREYGQQFERRATPGSDPACTRLIWGVKRVIDASSIPGWMDPGELQWLSERAAAASVIVEVGSWKGRSTQALACRTPGRVYAIDHWRGSAPELWKEIEERGPDSIFQDFLRNVAQHLHTGRVVPLRMESGSGAEIVRHLERSVDLVFLDADHTYEGCRADIEAYRSLVREGGILSGHDYGNPQWPGVKQSVDEAFRTVNRDALSIWWVRL